MIRVVDRVVVVKRLGHQDGGEGGLWPALEDGRGV